MAMRISAANLYDYLTGGWPPPGMGSVTTRLLGRRAAASIVWPLKGKTAALW